MGETVIERLGRNPGDAPAVVVPNGRLLSHRALLSGADHIAGQLTALGVRSGATAATVLTNGVAATQAYLGTLAVGRAAPLNPKLTVRELVEQLTGVDATLVLTTPARVAELAALPIDIPVFALEPLGQWS